MKNLSIRSAIMFFCVITFSACVALFDGPGPVGQPYPPPMNAEKTPTTPTDSEEELPTPLVSESDENQKSETSGEVEISDKTSNATAATGNCMALSSGPVPSLPETDCMAWSFLHSLVNMTNRMAGKDTILTEAELMTLETETYPLFVQTQINCGDWLEPVNDYEPITDFLGFLSFTGMNSYGYDTSALFSHLLQEASKEEFAMKSAEIGCTKSFFLLFVEYSE